MDGILPAAGETSTASLHRGGCPPARAAVAGPRWTPTTAGLTGDTAATTAAAPLGPATPPRAAPVPGPRGAASGPGSARARA